MELSGETQPNAVSNECLL